MSGGNKVVSIKTMTAEHKQLADSAARRADWKKCGPYLSERAWGTVHEDYSRSGDAWDLAFPNLPLAPVDQELAERQLIVLLREWYMHPNGQLQAYEWDFNSPF